MTRNSVVIVVLILATVGVYIYISQYQHRIEQQSAKINELEGKLKTASAPLAPPNGSLRDQMLCAQQAERAFESDQRTANTKDLHLISAHFVSHYQPSSNRCFVETDSTYISKDKSFTVTRDVSDAISGDLLGMYIWVNKDKKYWEVKPTMCDMIDQNGDKTYCQSDDEFTQLAAHYMK